MDSLGCVDTGQGSFVHILAEDWPSGFLMTPITFIRSYQAFFFLFIKTLNPAIIEVDCFKLKKSLGKIPDVDSTSSPFDSALSSF